MNMDTEQGAAPIPTTQRGMQELLADYLYWSKQGQSKRYFAQTSYTVRDVVLCAQMTGTDISRDLPKNDPVRTEILAHDEATSKKEQEEKLSQCLAALIDQRTANTLSKSDLQIVTVQDLQNAQAWKVMEVTNIGVTTFNQLEHLLKRLGLLQGSRFHRTRLMPKDIKTEKENGARPTGKANGEATTLPARVKDANKSTKRSLNTTTEAQQYYKDIVEMVLHRCDVTQGIASARKKLRSFARQLLDDPHTRNMSPEDLEEWLKEVCTHTQKKKAAK